MVSDMQEQGVVKPSNSPWVSPIVLVPKKDGNLRFSVDFRRLNSITRKDVYPLPRVEDIIILDTLGEAKYFTSLDLASGYWQVELDQDAHAKSAFTTMYTYEACIHVYTLCIAWIMCMPYLLEMLNIEAHAIAWSLYTGALTSI